MPLYEYQCEACAHRFEKIQKFSDPLIEECPHCGQRRVHKLVSSPAIQFKGTGWYITDYARKGAAGDPSSKTSDAKDGDNSSSESKSSESKAGDSKASESKSADSKGSDAKSADAKSADAKSSEPKAADAKPATTTSS